MNSRCQTRHHVAACGRKSLMTAATVTLGSERRWHGRLRLRCSFKPVPAAGRRAGPRRVPATEYQRAATWGGPGILVRSPAPSRRQSDPPSEAQGRANMEPWRTGGPGSLPRSLAVAFPPARGERHWGEPRGPLAGQAAPTPRGTWCLPGPGAWFPPSASLTGGPQAKCSV